jgi:hypothetical protein
MLAGGVWLALLLARLKFPVFRVAHDGIRLGKSSRRSRRTPVLVPWSSITAITVAPRPDGAAVDIVLSTAAPVRASSLPEPAQVALALIPGSYLWLKPPLLTALANPLRYHVPLTGAGPAEVGSALRARVPDSVTLTDTATAPRFG